MAITIEWEDSEQTILRIVYSGEWTWEEFHGASNEVSTLLDGVDHAVHFLIDGRHGVIPNDALLQLGDIARSLSIINHPNAAIIIIAGASDYLRTLVDIFSKVYPGRVGAIYFTNSLPEARILLHNLLAENHGI